MITDDTRQQFLDAMATRGLSLARGKDLIDDGHWHRCATPKSDDAGSYKLVSTGSRPWGLYRNWQDGQDTDYWHGDRSSPLTDAEREAIEAARAEHEREAAEKARRAAGEAEYSRLRAELRGLKEVNIRELDGAVKAAIEKAKKAAARAKAQKTTAQSKPDIDTLARSAKDIIASQDVLGLFGRAFGRAYAGERKIAKLLYLIATSRLFPVGETMHTAVKGASASGKSALVARVMEFLPPEDVIAFTAMSERALLYWPDDFPHKVISMAEAQEDGEYSFQNYFLRELMSAAKLRYPVAQKIDGEIQTVMIEKNGPVTFVVTTTRNKLHPENETRMLSLEIDDSEEQTKRVIKMVAEVRGLNAKLDDVNFAAWRDFQRWLAAGDKEVYIGFAPELSALVPPRAVRVRRDFSQLLGAIKAHALLHRDRRKRTKLGEIIATVEDYAAVRELLVDVLAEAAEVKASRAVHETVAAVEAAQPEPGPRDEARGAEVLAIARELNLDRSTARRRLRKAEDLGFVVNLETGRGRPGRYIVARRNDKAIEMLPTVATLAKAYEAALHAEAEGEEACEGVGGGVGPTPS